MTARVSAGHPIRVMLAAAVARRIDYARCSPETLAELALETLGSDTRHY